ncbi:jg20772 [Pararge aegeria aegeria]|uniref:Jg20772 protein n=1 Tax=Pararge aegeria aegeria TaxID=348720 RepID=A0A8S4R2Y8_9NEOP|nr:jg20772 [Pararge aegeria aegeria]
MRRPQAEDPFASLSPRVQTLPGRASFQEELELPTSSSTSREVAMGDLHSSENRWTLGFQGVGMHRKRSVGRPQGGGRRTSSESLGAAGIKRRDCLQHIGLL